VTGLPHRFQEGDPVVVSVRAPNGEVVEDEGEYDGIYCDGEAHTWLSWYLYRPDSVTDAASIDRIVAIRLNRPRRD
jgi:hypothetical protein